jgi:hypothetical protein
MHKAVAGSGSNPHMRLVLAHTWPHSRCPLKDNVLRSRTAQVAAGSTINDARGRLDLFRLTTEAILWPSKLTKGLLLYQLLHDSNVDGSSVDIFTLEIRF